MYTRHFRIFQDWDHKKLPLTPNFILTVCPFKIIPLESNALSHSATLACALEWIVLKSSFLMSFTFLRRIPLMTVLSDWVWAREKKHTCQVERVVRVVLVRRCSSQLETINCSGHYKEACYHNEAALSISAKTFAVSYT